MRSVTIQVETDSFPIYTQPIHCTVRSARVILQGQLNRQCGALVHSGPLQVPTSGSTLPFALMIAYFLASSASLKFDIFCIFAIVEMILNGLYNYSKYFTWFWLIFYLGSYMEKSVIPIYKSQQQGRPSPNSSTSSAAEEPAS